MRKQFTNKIIALLLIVFVASCQKEKQDDRIGTYAESGSAIVVNEGAFGNNNGSVSFIDRNGKVTNNIFELANGGASLGDVVQSYTLVGNKGIICVNNSTKVEIVDARTFKRLGTITDAAKTNYARYAVGVNNDKAYVSNGSSDGIVAVINLNDYTITKTIEVGKGPEQMVLSSNKVYVCNSGGWDIDNTLSVINTATETVDATITVGNVPTKIVKDALGYLWVLCTGGSDYSDYLNVTKLGDAKLVRINTSSNTIDKSFTLINAGETSIGLDLTIGDNGRTIYYAVGDNVYALGINESTLPTTALFAKNNIYGLSASPYNNQIWAMQAPNFSSGGYVFRYSSIGSLIDSIKVGIGPNNAVFNP